ncbi:hypothetical protein HAX54_025915, partial [Datura stramonium]|nr:hypothetical protein [Datura stramonium]
VEDLSLEFCKLDIEVTTRGLEVRSRWWTHGRSLKKLYVMDSMVTREDTTGRCVEQCLALFSHCTRLGNYEMMEASK